MLSVTLTNVLGPLVFHWQVRECAQLSCILTSKFVAHIVTATVNSKFYVSCQKTVIKVNIRMIIFIKYNTDRHLD